MTETRTSTPLEADIAGLIQDSVAALGFALLRVRFAGGLLQVMAEPHEASAPMTVDDCVRISRAISPSLDASDKIRNSYRLEVTTPGIARPLWSQADYQRFVGAQVKITTRELLDGRRRFAGRLAGVSGDGIVSLDTDDGRVDVAYALIEAGKLDAAAILADGKQHNRQEV